MNVWVAVLVGALGACGQRAGTDGQTAREGLAIACDAIARSDAYRLPRSQWGRHVARWIEEHVSNREIREWLASLDTIAPAEREPRIAAALSTYELANCPLVQTPAVWSPLDVPHVPASGLSAPPRAPMVVVTHDSLLLDGLAIVSVVNDRIDPASVDGVAIPRLRGVLAEHQHQAPGAQLVIGVAAALPFRLLAQVMVTAAQASYREVALLVREDHADTAIPVQLHDVAAGEPGIVLVGTATSVAVTSPLAAPRLDVPLAEPVDLSPIVARLRELARPRPTTEILARFAADTPLQTVAEVLAAVQTVPGVSVSLAPAVE